MTLETSKQFSRKEMAFREMLGSGGKLVGDKWFAGDSSEYDRARYLVACTRRQERNRRRCERRKHQQRQSLPTPSVRGDSHGEGSCGGTATSANPGGCSNRSRRRIIPVNHEAQVANRLPLERRKCSRRSTLAKCPTPLDIRTAWHFRNSSNAACIRLGGMLLDLECYVDNSLITIVCNHRLKIVGRHGGLREWIRENCPELSSHYKTLQRIKGMAKLLRQRLDVMDPVPVSMLMSNTVTSDTMQSLVVHVQPRGDDEKIPQVHNRFPWESSPLKFDADGRPYFDNDNYTAARFEISSDFLRQVAAYRAIFRAAIILNGKEKCANENYSEGVEDGCGNDAATRAKDDDLSRSGNDDGGIVGEFRCGCREMGEMFRYIGKNPKFLAEVGMGLGKEIGSLFGDLLLPERTMTRIRDGERVGIGTVVLDMMGAYGKIYSACLVYRWGRGYDERWR